MASPPASRADQSRSAPLEGAPHVGATSNERPRPEAPGGKAQHARRSPLAVARVLVRHQRANVRLHAEPRARVRVRHAPAELDARPGLGVPAVVAKPELEPRREHAPVSIANGRLPTVRARSST